MENVCWFILLHYQGRIFPYSIFYGASNCLILNVSSNAAATVYFMGKTKHNFLWHFTCFNLSTKTSALNSVFRSAYMALAEVRGSYTGMSEERIYL